MLKGILGGTLEGIIIAIPRGILNGIRKESLTNPQTLRIPYGILTKILERILIGSIRVYKGL